MAYIDVDIEDYLDEVNTYILIDEIRKRAEKNGQDIFQFIIETDRKNGFMDPPLPVQGNTLVSRIAMSVGLNHLASKQDIIEEIKKL